MTTGPRDSCRLPMAVVLTRSFTIFVHSVLCACARVHLLNEEKEAKTERP